MNHLIYILIICLLCGLLGTFMYLFFKKYKKETKVITYGKQAKTIDVESQFAKIYEKEGSLLVNLFNDQEYFDFLEKLFSHKYALTFNYDDYRKLAIKKFKSVKNCEDEFTSYLFHYCLNMSRFSEVPLNALCERVYLALGGIEKVALYVKEKVIDEKYAYKLFGPRFVYIVRVLSPFMCEFNDEKDKNLYPAIEYVYNRWNRKIIEGHS